MERYEIGIIGGGPAGLTAAIYAGGAGLSCCIIEKGLPGGQMGEAWEIENFPGFRRIAGQELAERMRRQAEESGAALRTAEVIGARLSGEEKRLFTRTDEFACRAVILAPGASPRRLGVPGEAEYAGRGVSWCASCDGRFFRGKRVAVIGGGESAFAEARYLTNLCEKVTLVHRYGVFEASSASVERLKRLPNAEILTETEVLQIEGDGGRVTELILLEKTSGKTFRLSCGGVFEAVGRIPQTERFRDLLPLDEDGYLLTDRELQTAEAGVFAAGDGRKGAFRQIAGACADGAKAASAAIRMLGQRGEGGPITEQQTDGTMFAAR